MCQVLLGVREQGARGARVHRVRRRVRGRGPHHPVRALRAGVPPGLPLPAAQQGTVPSVLRPPSSYLLPTYSIKDV